jgi:hypothetical protein
MIPLTHKNSTPLLSQSAYYLAKKGREFLGMFESASLTQNLRKNYKKLPPFYQE